MFHSFEYREDTTLMSCSEYQIDDSASQDTSCNYDFDKKTKRIVKSNQTLYWFSKLFLPNRIPIQLPNNKNAYSCSITLKSKCNTSILIEDYQFSIKKDSITMITVFF